MKMYTTQDQTAKLIELGFEKPRTQVTELYEFGETQKIVARYAYSLGELLELLQKGIEAHSGLTHYWLMFEYNEERKYWKVEYAQQFELTIESELIDAIYKMCVKLKDKEVI